MPLVPLPNVPGAHAVSHANAPLVLKVPHGHVLHGSKLVPALNEPAAHGRHAPSHVAASASHTADSPGPHNTVGRVFLQSVADVLPVVCVKGRAFAVATPHDLHFACPLRS